MKHVYAIPAYKDSPYLTDCIASLEKQQVKSPVLLCTATPSDRLKALAEQHGFSYHVNPDAPDIAGDWNFAMKCARAEGADFVTLCHQDDIYLPGYGAAFHKMAAAHDDILIFFTDYGEQRGDQLVTRSRLLNIKRALLWMMRIKPFQTWRFAKRRTLSLGDPICCPSVTMNLNRLPDHFFQRGMITNLDWQAWETASNMPGRFAYHREMLMLHRIHPSSTTSQVLGEGGRGAQDEIMFRKFWIAPIAKVLARLYASSEKSNNL